MVHSVWSIFTQFVGLRAAVIRIMCQKTPTPFSVLPQRKTWLCPEYHHHHQSVASLGGCEGTNRPG